MLPSVTIYFYRTRNRDNVIERWERCVVVPAVGITVLLGEDQAHARVDEVRLSKPNPHGLQIADVYVTIPTEAHSMRGVQYGDHNIQHNVFGT